MKGMKLPNKKSIRILGEKSKLWILEANRNESKSKK